jgi:hypothetical protein
MILGGGDKLVFSTACGHRHDVPTNFRFNPQQSQHYQAWAGPFQEAIGQRIGFLEGNAFHLWHGELSNRGYSERFEGFERYAFDPNADIALTEDGAWRWDSDKPALHEHVRRYFESRAGIHVALLSRALF